MTPFLKTIVTGYLDKYGSLDDFLFVFPNKRSALFFNNYLKNELKERGLAGDEDLEERDVKKETAKTVTISDFVLRLSERRSADKFELIFILYNCYKKLINENKIKTTTNETKKEIEEENPEYIDFENFRIWGETVLNDFNLVDQYLVDPEELFKNVKDFREISSNFLTDDQKEVIEEYFRHKIFDDTKGFWRDFADEEEHLSELKRRFLYLWKILHPLYQEFQATLKEKRLCTSGSVYREAYENILKKGRRKLSLKKVVFIGFNALTTSEKAIFKELKKWKSNTLDEEPFADFIWDYTGPVICNDENSSSRFVKSDIKWFPSPEWIENYLEKSTVKELPELTIISSPSKVAQTKIAGELLKDLRNRIGSEPFKDAKVALILPDESLLMPMLYSIGPEIRDINLTMGIPFRQTGVFSFLQSIARLLQNMTITNGDKSFYNKDLNLFLSHRFAKVLFTSGELDEFKMWMNRYHKVRITLSEMGKIIAGAEKIFDMPAKDSPFKVMGEYLKDLIHLVSEMLIDIHKEEPNNVLDISNLATCGDALEIFITSLKNNSISLHAGSFLKMFERLVSSGKVLFKGKPLIGLQVMGMLETRSLDFDYLYVLSMNEKIMPKKSYGRSFIPETLRRGYGLPPLNYSEELFAYYFYRLISRAKEVTLLYDGRGNTGFNSGGVSRYILQLKYLFAKDKIKELDFSYQLKGKETVTNKIVKTEEIKAELKRFTEPGGKNFSASSLSAYKKCELMFYYESIKNLDSDPERGDFIDAIAQGDIVHNVMMNVYLPKDLQRKLLSKPVVIDKKKIEDLLENEGFIWKLIVESINRDFYHLEENITRELRPSDEIIGRQLLSIIKTILRHDLTLAPFSLYGSEIKKQTQIKLKSGKTVNFKYAIDRMDEIEFEGELRQRIIDYKTGGKHLNALTIEDVLKGDYRSDQIFQLFTYAWLLGKDGEINEERLMTEIYSSQDFTRGFNGLPVIGEGKKDYVKSFGEYSAPFSEGLEKMIEEIFEKPEFEECENELTCRQCSFRRLCNK